MGDDVHLGDCVELTVAEQLGDDARDAAASQPADEEQGHRVGPLRRDPKRDSPEVGIDLAELQEGGDAHLLAVAVRHPNVGLSAREILEGDAQGRAGIVERSESIFPVRIFLRLEHDRGIQSETTGKDGVVRGLDRAPGQDHPCRPHRQGRLLAFDDQTGCLDRLGRDSQQPGYDIRRPDRDDAEGGIGLDQALRDMVDDAIPAHRHDDAGTVLDSLCRLDLGVGRGFGPNGLDFRDPTKYRHHRPMGATGELRRRGIGHDHDAVH